MSTDKGDNYRPIHQIITTTSFGTPHVSLSIPNEEKCIRETLNNLPEAYVIHQAISLVKNKGIQPIFNCGTGSKILFPTENCHNLRKALLARGHIEIPKEYREKKALFACSIKELLFFLDNHPDLKKFFFQIKKLSKGLVSPEIFIDENTSSYPSN